MALPAYDQCIKASHVFNLLDARGVISVTERQSYILRVRELAKACGEAWLATGGGRGRMSEPEIGGRQPLMIGVEAGETYWWCRCGAQVAAVLRRLARGRRIRADGMEGDRARHDQFLHLQAHGRQPICDNSILGNLRRP